MKKILMKIAAVAMSVLMVSNVSVFAIGNSHAANEKKEYVKTGTISEIHPNNIVLGEKSEKVIFRITDKTLITDEKEKSIKLFDLKTGTEVEVTYEKTSNGAANKSFDAKSIKISKNICEISDAIIQEISPDIDDTLLVQILFETVDSKNRIIENTMNLVVDNNTEIINQFGAKTAKSGLRVGMVIDVEHSKMVTKSYIPQTYSGKINIVKESENSTVIETKILEKNIYADAAYVLVGNPDKVNEQILLVLSDKTLLKDKNGNNITLAKLKAGNKIKTEYSLNSTKSLPAQAQAYLIQIIDEEVLPVDAEFKEIYDLLEKLFKQLGVDNWLECVKDKNINWDIDYDDDMEDIIEEIVEHVLGDDYDDDDYTENKVESLIEKLIREMKNKKN